MAKTTKTTTHQQVTHPVEDVFDIEPGTTLVELEQRSTELVPHETYDEKDRELEDQFQEVYDAAFDAFESQSQEAELVEGKYKARNMEVAANLLNTALNAAKEKATMKQHKDKLQRMSPKDMPGGARTVNNNIIVDRNDLLKQILSQDPDEKDITPKE